MRGKVRLAMSSAMSSDSVAAMSDSEWVDFLIDAPDDPARAEFVARLRDCMPPDAEVHAGQGGEELPTGAPLHRHRSTCSICIAGEGSEGTAETLRKALASLDVEVDDSDLLMVILT